MSGSGLTRSGIRRRPHPAPHEDLNDRASRGRRVAALLDQAAVSGTNLASQMAVGYACAPEQFGVLVLVFTLLLFWDGVRYSFLASPVVVFLPRRLGAAVGPYVGDTFQMLGAILVAGVVFFALGAGFAWLSGNMLLARGILVGSLALTGWSAREHVRTLFFARLRAGSALLVDATYAVLQLSAVAVLWAVDRLDVFSLLAAVGAAQLTAAGLGLFLMRRLVVFRTGGFRRIVVAHWRFGRWILAAALVYAVAAQIYPWFLNGLHGLEAAAALGACQLPLCFARPLVIGLVNILTPELSHHRARNGIHGFHRRVRAAQILLLVPLLLLAGLIALFARDILNLMYDGKYVEYAPILSLLTLQLVVVALGYALNLAFLVMDRPRYHFYVTVVGAVLTLTVGLALTWHCGVLGAGGGLLAVMVGTGIAAFVLYRRADGARERKRRRGRRGDRLTRTSRSSGKQRRLPTGQSVLVEPEALPERELLVPRVAIRGF